MKYILAIDQSTQATKAILTDEQGRIVGRTDKAHRQIINEKGWVSHDLEEIYQNVLLVSRNVLEEQHISPDDVAAIGISNQRESTGVWKKDGTPIGYSIVWQCGRAAELMERYENKQEMIREKTGLPLSPFFPAAKMAWLIEDQIPKGVDYCLGTMDSYLIYRLTNGSTFKTDYSNASRTQLFNLSALKWDEELCRLFGVPMSALPQIEESNGDFGNTTMEGLFEKPVPICSVLGDSHAALFAQGCHSKGMVKATYGTGSSIMMNVGETYRKSEYGLAVSLAWGMDHEVNYVLEGNINYTGAVISWLQQDLQLISSVAEIEPAVQKANPADTTVLVPAFTGLSAPHWDNEARALIYGMSRTTGKNELVKAATDSIAYQITDVLEAMQEDSGTKIQELRVDGGPSRNEYLMQFQSDMAQVTVSVPEAEEFSALGVAYMAGIKAGIYKKEQLFNNRKSREYRPNMEESERQEKQKQWNHALHMSMSKTK